MQLIYVTEETATNMKLIPGVYFYVLQECEAGTMKFLKAGVRYQYNDWTSVMSGMAPSKVWTASDADGFFGWAASVFDSLSQNGTKVTVKLIFSTSTEFSAPSTPHPWTQFLYG